MISAEPQRTGRVELGDANGTHRWLHCTNNGQSIGRHLPIHLTTILHTHCEHEMMSIQSGVRETGGELEVNENTTAEEIQI